MIVTHSQFPKTFEPIELGSLKLKNRIFVPAHTTNYGADHLPTKRHRDYHRARARGGASMVIFESIRVHPHSLGRPQAVGGYERACIAPFRSITDAVHREGIPILGQVIHLGRQIPGEFERAVAWGPSAIRWSASAAMPHAMYAEEIEEVIAAHVTTARNVLEAGFDGFEVHLGHGHLLQQFLSPSSNQRIDEFGGSEENRLRFPLAVLTAVRDAVGPDVCMGVRVSGEEYIEDGLHLDEMCRQMTRIAARVQLDFVNTSHSAYHGSYSLATQMADMAIDPAMFRVIPRAFSDTLRAAGHAMPVLSVCKYRSVAEAEEMIAAGHADMVGMARAHMADPDLVKKSESGRTDAVIPCIACNQGCAGNLQKDLALTCLVNPRMGLESTWPVPEEAPVDAPRDILVVGAGPAGCEAAWVAAARGHHVTLWEQSEQLGGQLALAAQMPSRIEFAKLLDYQARRCAAFNVRIELGVEGTLEAIAEAQPDEVVLATGSVPEAMVFEAGAAGITLHDAIRFPERLGASVAFYDTIGEWSTLSAIEHLAELGKRITVFSPIAAFSWRTTIYSTYANSKRLRDHGITIALLRRVLGHTNEGLLVEDVSTGDVQALPGFDSVVAVAYNAPNDTLHTQLRTQGIAVKTIGDALAPRTALEAIYEGHERAMLL